MNFRTLSQNRRHERPSRELVRFRLHGSLLLCLLAFSAGATTRPAAAQSSSDVATIRSRWESWAALESLDRGTVQQRALELAATQSTDGCWATVDYADVSKSVWGTAEHLTRLDRLAVATYVLRRDGMSDERVNTAAINAMRCWLSRDPHNPNWWWNEIGVPKSLGRSALLMGPLLTAQDRSQVDKVLRRSDWSKWTGQNLVWGVDIELLRGLLDNDAVAVQQAFSRLFEEIRIAPSIDAGALTSEGIQADGSFHQHGSQLYSGGYGYAFGLDVGRDIVLGWGTAFQIPADPMRVYTHFLLDGQQWMIHAGVFDYVARGREITRAAGSDSNHSDTEFVRVVQGLADLPSVRQNEFREFAASLRIGNGSKEPAGNRGFWNSDLMVQKRPGYTTNVRMLSIRSKNEESLNGEGLRSMHLADGVNLLYKRGDEYAEIFPAWDWNRIPGTTAMQWTDANGVPVTGETKPVGLMGTNEFAGEVSDGTYGAAAMELQRGPLTARKAWFFFDRVYVALGAGITVKDTSDVPKVPVVTTIEQNIQRGEVMQGRLPDGRTLVAHNGVGYLLEPGAQVQVQAGAQSGSWSLIGTGPAAKVTLPVFELALSHGVLPQNSSYRYEVLPEGGMDAARAEAKTPRVHVLANEDHVQAVCRTDGNLLMAVFYAPGKLATPLGMLTVSAASMVMVRDAGKNLEITASNPLGAALELRVVLGDHIRVFQLPGGNMAGSSQTQTIAR